VARDLGSSAPADGVELIALEDPPHEFADLRAVLLGDHH
jgi:hypothetical protein